jgi:FlaA1/EpsC-like NDP-sugar epimerase
MLIHIVIVGGVYGPGAGLRKLIRKHGVEQVLIALRPELKCRTMPALGQIIQGGPRTGQIRDVAVEDLLGRRVVSLEEARIRSRLEGVPVLVTGAGGSIGSELCRQLTRFRPASIVACEISENALFFLDQEMRAIYPDVPFHPHLGNVQNERRLREIFALHEPRVVYHAAAYKHVPLMESHIVEAVENNIFGTYALETVAAEHHIRDFVMISSDKAVRPTSIMGATKRVAEMLVRSFEGNGTRFISVRFGNVLGSNGSVVPLFKEQIARGGPVTVTHPEMQRYFMTISEAVQLVIQSSSMSAGGEIYMLDMGEPVRILDLAKKLILLSGLRPEKDIRIEFTGIRPGEKLFEELNTGDENLVATSHEKVFALRGDGAPPSLLGKPLADLNRYCHERDSANLVLTLKEMVPEYNPSSQLLKEALHWDAVEAGAGR